MKKKNFLLVLIGIFIPISVLSGEYQATLDMINGKLGDIEAHSSQINQYTGQIDGDTSAMKGEVHQILSRVETIDNAATSISGTTLDIRQYLNNICYGKGEVGGWFRSMYDIALDMQTKYNKLVSDLESLYTHVSTTQKYQLDDIKESNQTISDNTTSIKETTKNIETSTDVIEAHTETIATDTTSLNEIFSKQYTKVVRRALPILTKPSLDAITPNISVTTQEKGNALDVLLEQLSALLHNQSNDTLVNMSSLMNLQAIRTNLNFIAELIEAKTNTFGEITVDQLADITADLLPDYGIDVSTHDLPNVQENFTGDFHSDLLKLTRFNASVNVSASYAAISILTNFQSLLSRNADEVERNQLDSINGGIANLNEEYANAEQTLEHAGIQENLTIQNESMKRYEQNAPTFASLSQSSISDSIGFTIESIRLTEGATPQNLKIEQSIPHMVKDMIEVIRTLVTVTLWGVGLFLTYLMIGYLGTFLSWALGLIHPNPVRSGIFMKTGSGGIV